MLTLSQQRDLYGELTIGTANVSNLDFGERIIRAETRRIVSKIGDHLLHTTSNATAVVNQQEYELPNKIKKLRGVTFKIGSNVQYVRQSPNRAHWDSLNTASSTAHTANFPEYYYIIARKISYWPTPSSGSATITYDYDVRFIDQTIADYTTGTIGTVVLGSTTVGGNSTVWGSAMVSRFLQINKSDTYVNDGDADFYQIASVQSTTQLNLVKPYAGHSIGGGLATYRVGEVSPLPDGFHELPVYRACEFYYSKSDQARSAYFKGLARELEEELMNANDPSELVMVEDVDDIPENPNLYVRGIG